MIKVFLMNTPAVYEEGRRIPFAYRKEEGLFYYLCVEGTVTRGQAASLFWADCDDQTARKNLRNALYRLRRLFGEEILKISGNSLLELDRTRVWVDVEALTDENILEKYRGDFLGYFYIKDCPEFEEWAEKERYRLKTRYVEACRLSVERAIRCREAGKVRGQYITLLENGFFEEALYREWMELEAREGNYNEAIRLYQKLSQTLRTELDIGPEQETEALYRRIRRMKEEASGAGAAREDAWFYGRQEELYVLREELRLFFDETGSGRRAWAVKVWGEAGVGKTSLLREFRRFIDESRVQVLRYQCSQTGEGLSYRPWYDLCGQMRERGMDGGRKARAENPFLELSGAWDETLFPARLELFVEYSIREEVKETGKRVVLLIDDIQWMDDASQKLLGNLLYHLGGSCLFLAAACRGGGAQPFEEPLLSAGRVRRLEVPGFTREESREIIAHLLPASGPELAERIWQSTDGNALFLMETLKMLQSRPGGGEPDLKGFPPGLVHIMEGRLLPLSERDRRVLDALSIQAEFMTLEDVRAVARMPEPELSDSLDALIRAQLICEQETAYGLGYTFVHRLIQDYVYERLTNTRKRVSHRLFGEYLETEPAGKRGARQYPYLVYHFQRCGDLYKTYLYKLEYLISFYTVYHEVYPSQEEYVEGAAPWQPQLTDVGALQETAREIRGLSRDQDNPRVWELRMRAEYLAGRCAVRYCDYERGLPEISLALEIAKRLEAEEFIFQCSLVKIFYAIQVLNLELMAECLDEIEPMSRRQPARRAAWLRLRGLYLLRTGAYEEAGQILRETIDLYDAAGGRLLASEAHREEEDRFRKAGICPDGRENPPDMALAACYSYLGECCWQQGERRQAMGCLKKAISLGEAGRVTNGSAVFYTTMAHFRYQEGDLGGAEEYAKKARQAFRQTDAVWGRERLEILLGLLAMEKQEFARAGEYLESARRLAKRVGNPESLRLAGEAREQLNKRLRDL